MPSDFRVSITNAPGKHSYSIASFTWLLVPERIDDRDKKLLIKELLRWMLTTGQDTSVESLLGQNCGKRIKGGRTDTVTSPLSTQIWRTALPEILEFLLAVGRGIEERDSGSKRRTNCSDRLCQINGLVGRYEQSPHRVRAVGGHLPRSPRTWHFRSVR